MTAVTQKPVIHRADLARRVGSKFGSNAAALAAVNYVMEELIDALAAGQTVYIKGLGRFEPVTTPPRQGRNPKTGEPCIIPPGRRIKFRPAAALRHLSEFGALLAERDASAAALCGQPSTEEGE